MPRGIIDGRTVTVPARIGGVVTAIHVGPGEEVSQGQLLATVDETQLASGNANSPAAIEFREVRAPVAGRVTTVAASVGEFVAESDDVATILDTKSIVARLYLSEELASNTSCGQRLLLGNASGLQLAAAATFAVERHSDILVPLPSRLPQSETANDLVVEVVARPTVVTASDGLRVGSIVTLLDVVTDNHGHPSSAGGE